MTRQTGKKVMVVSLALVALAALVLAGCGSSGSSSSGGSTSTATAKPGGVIHIAQLTDPATLNPAEIIEAPALAVSAQINETLFKYDEAGKLVPLLATGYKSSDDGLTWTISLRGGVDFSNGTPMTAKDVVFTIEQDRKSAYWAGIWEEVESVRALSPTTVQIKTKTPMVSMLADLALYSSAIVPDGYGGVSEEEFAQHPVGTGPFVFENWAHGQAITLTKNPHYWQSGEPVAAEVEFSTIPDDNSRLAQLRGGEVDLLFQPVWSQVNSLEQTAGIRVSNYGMLAFSPIILNLKYPLFKDHRVREAMSLALDREGIVAAALGGTGEPAGSFLPPSVQYHDSDIEAPQQDVARAKQLLAEAVKAGVNPSFTLATWAGQAFQSVAAQIIQQDLNEVGFHVTLRQYDESALIEKTDTGQLEASLLYWYSAVADPSELVPFYIETIAKPNGMQTGPLEKLWAKARSELNPGKREALLTEIQELVAEELQVVPINYEPNIWAMQDSLVGVEVNPLNTLYLNKAGFTG